MILFTLFRGGSRKFNCGIIGLRKSYLDLLLLFDPFHNFSLNFSTEIKGALFQGLKNLKIDKK